MPETEFLVFRLYGPLSAWGDIAVGEVRPVLLNPTKSALVGLLGAALGIRRSEEERLSDLSVSYGFAAASEGRMTRIRDYHTVQSLPEKKFRKYGSGCQVNRQRELSVDHDDLGTILTYRDYVCDVVYSAAVWVKGESAPFSLDELAEALRMPKFVPYLGRKSCVLSRPMEPQVVLALDPVSALRNAVFYGDSGRKLSEGRLPVFRVEWKDGKPHDLREGQVVFEGDWDVPKTTSEQCRDEPGSRRAWQFRNRAIFRAKFSREVI